MTLRRKFIVALIGMVIIMAFIFAAISLSSMSSLLGHTVNYIEQSYTQQWERLLTAYYQEHSSWDGVQQYINRVINDPGQRYSLLSRQFGPFLVFDQNNQVVASSRPRDVGKALKELPAAGNIPAQRHEIQVNGQTVGYFWIDRNIVSRETYLARGIANSLIISMLIGLIITSLLALLVGVLLTRHFTLPLRALTGAVQRVATGDLTTRLTVKGRDDIADLSRAFNTMTEQLARNEEVRRNMVADIAHELRTPLSVILGKLESIQEGVLPASPETLLPIQDETIRLIRLVRDLQQLSLAEAGKLPMNLQQVDLRQLVEKILGHFAFEFDERGLQAEIEGGVPPVQADPDRLTQVLVNIVGNALYHTPGGGRIQVILAEAGAEVLPLPEREPSGGERRLKISRSGHGSLARKEAKLSQRWVKVTVADTGEGIPPQELAHIFDRFYRVTKARERESGGTGLGLAIAKEFVEAHGGKITVASTPGQGTSFTVWIPTSENNYF